MTDAGRRTERLTRGALALTVSATLGLIATHAIRSRASEPSLPLDDAFIHFQYARSFAELRPFVYTPGSEPAPGATSLLWPAMLAPFHALGLGSSTLIWVAWVFGFWAFALLMLETRRLALGLTTERGAAFAAVLVACFGGYSWFAASGMEVVPFAWLLMRSACQVAGWGESAAPARHARLELCTLGVVTPLMRPEGMLACLLIACALVVFPRGASRVWAAVPLFGALTPMLLNWLFTGQTMNTTATSKWLLLSPYQYGGRVFDLIFYNVRLLFGTLLNGEVWSSVFLPEGSAWLSWLVLPAIIVAGFQSQRRWRASCVLAIALGMLIPTTYDSFLWNRLRYLWPFAGAWFIGIAVLADGAAAMLFRVRPGLSKLRGGFEAFCCLALALRLPSAIEDLAHSADAVRLQQVALGRWVRQTLPSEARIGVNDTGAIAYFGERRTFDIVGLTTLGEAKYWAAGAGSRFEHYEKMPRHALPTHFVVYPEWFAIPALLGPALTIRSVPGATILGGEMMVAYEADYRALGSLEASPLGNIRTRDVLDVADLESEAAHGYELFWGSQLDNVVVGDETGTLADGARAKRTLDRFELDLEPGGTLVARIAGVPGARLRVRVATRQIGELRSTGNAWDELLIVLPRAISAGRQLVELSAAEGQSFASLHYWSYAASAGR